eukprot:TRINITY_DN11557_c0_g1_i1.p1 TRINITY_DN11557_c0_g1~~TRINITY_DN11557_c0_g1_i1.p1  ORF type:complete len:1394 (+),score=407.83 TRINITY_DN11557_c0_g1_i1:102-4283(+)
MAPRVWSILCAAAVGASGRLHDAEKVVLDGLLDGRRLALPSLDLEYGPALRNWSFTEIEFVDCDVGFAEPSDPHARSGLLTFSATFAAKLVGVVNRRRDANDTFQPIEAEFEALYLPKTMRVNMSNPSKSIAEGDATQATVTYGLQGLTPTLRACPVPDDGSCDDIIREVFMNLATPQYAQNYEALFGALTTAVLAQLDSHTHDHRAPTPHAVQTAKEQEAPIARHADDPAIINLSDKNATAVRLIDFAVNSVYGYRGETGRTSLGDMLTHFLAGQTFSNLSIPLHRDSPEHPFGVSVRVITATLGRDVNISRFDATPVGNYSVLFSGQLSGCDVDVVAELNLTNTATGALVERQLRNVSYAGVDIELNVSVLLAVNLTSYGERFLGSLLPLPDLDRTTWEGLKEWWSLRQQCWAEFPLLALNVSTLSLDVQNYTVLHPSALIPDEWPNVQALYNATGYFLHRTYRSNMDANIQLSSHDLLATLSTSLGGIPHRVGTCPLVERPLPPFDFSNSTVVRLLGYVANKLVGTAHGWGVSGWLAAYLRAFPPLNVERVYDYAREFGSIDVHFWNLELPSTFYLTTMELFVPRGQYELEFKSAAEQRCGMTMDVEITGTGSGVDFSNHFSFGVMTESVKFDAIVYAVMNERRWNWMPLRHLANATCVVGELMTVAFPSTVMSAVGYNVSLECYECSSPGLWEASRTLQSASGVAQLQHHLAEVLQATADVLKSEKFNDMVTKGLATANRTCAAIEAKDPAPQTAAPEVAAMYWEGLFGRKRIGQEGTPSPPAAGLTQSNEDAIMFTAAASMAGLLVCYTLWAYGKYKRDQFMDQKANNDRQLAKHPEVAKWARWGVALGVLASLGLLVAGTLRPAAVLKINAEVAGSPIRVRHMYVYTLPSALRDLWNSGAYGIACIVMVLSGVGPYVKLWVMAWCWLAPPCVLPRPRRLKYLELAAWCGKWGLATVFLVVLIMATLGMTFGIPNTVEYLPQQFVLVNLFLAPEPGLYMYLAGLMLSTAVNYFMMSTARRVDVADEHGTIRRDWFVSFSKDRSILAFQRLASEPQSAIHTELAKLLGLWLFSLAMFVAGCVVEVCSFNVTGLAGYAADMYATGASQRGFRLTDVASRLFEQRSVDGQDFGYIAVALAHFTSVFLMPLLQYVAVVVLCAAPLTINEQKVLFAVTDVLAAWCSLDVFMVTLAAWIYSVDNLTNYFVGNSCTMLNEFLLWFNVVNPIIPFMNGYEKVCYNVVADCSAGTWLLLFAALCAMLVFRFIRSYAEMMIHCRDDVDEGKTPRLGRGGVAVSPTTPIDETTALADGGAPAPPSTVFLPSPRSPVYTVSGHSSPFAAFFKSVGRDRGVAVAPLGNSARNAPPVESPPRPKPARLTRPISADSVDSMEY